MSLASLLTMKDRAFAWEHEMSHRTLLSTMPPVDRFSVPPYFVEPQMNTGGWLMDHAQAHDDFRVSLPVLWGWWYLGNQEFGIASGNNLMDANLNSSDQVPFWTFVNHMDHYVATSLLTAEVVVP